VRVRDHVVLSTAGAALLAPWIGRRVLGPWAASILIDADHYVWFCVRHRRLSPLAAMQFFDEAHPPRHSATRLLHSPAFVLTMLLLGARRRRALPVALGIAAHVALDLQHEARMDRARDAALRRDDRTCETCGARGARVETHLFQQPRLLPSYGTSNLVSLCSRCHEDAHFLRGPTFSPEARAVAPERRDAVNGR
jgi:hypothetical protein